MKIGKYKLTPTWKSTCGIVCVALYGFDHWLIGPGSPTAQELHLPSQTLAVVAFVLVLLSKEFAGVDPSVSTTSQKGFVRLREVGFLAVLGILLSLACAPRPAARLSAVESAAVAVQAEGCSWLNSGGGAVIAEQAEKELACVLAQLLAGGNVPVNELAKCASGAVADVFADLESLAQYYFSGAVDGGGVGASGMVCAAASAKPPYAGIPTCISAAQLALLQTKRGEAKALLAGGAK